MSYFTFNNYCTICKYPLSKLNNLSALSNKSFLLELLLIFIKLNLSHYKYNMSI